MEYKVPITGAKKAGEGMFIKFDSFGNRRRDNEIEVKGFWRRWSMWHAMEPAGIAVEAEADAPNKVVKTSRHPFGPE